MQNDGKILYLHPQDSRRFRLKRKYFNYYKGLFVISLSFNIILAVALYVKS